jgi:peptide/nickel transport system ATP-binding protein
MNMPVLSIEKLSVALPAGADRVHALQDISLQLQAGQTLCVVGESGSGKSVLATTVMGLLAADLKVVQGSVALQGEALLLASPARLRALRGQAMGMVFQEPMTALNPVMRCGDQVDEVLRIHTDWPRAQRRAHGGSLEHAAHLGASASASQRSITLRQSARGTFL